MTFGSEPALWSVDEQSGFARIDGASLSGFEAACAAALSLLAARVSDLGGKKSYLNGVLAAPDFTAFPDIVRIALDDRLLEAARAYLGEPAVLRSVQVFYTPPNDTTAGSQKAHFDHVGERQLKLFVYFSDVGPADGPLCLISADVSAAHKGREGKGGRFEDADIANVPANRAVEMTGPAGSAILADTTRCLHYGGRSRENARVMYVAQYVRAGDNFEASGVLRPVAPAAWPLSDLQRAALQI